MNHERRLAALALSAFLLIALCWLAVRAWRADGGASIAGDASATGAEPSESIASLPRANDPEPSARQAAREPETPSAPAVERLELALVVLDPARAPVAGAEVLVWPGDDESAALRYLTDATGRVQVETAVDPHECVAEASAAGIGGSGLVRLRVQGRDAQGMYELTLSALGTVAGVVLGADGQPMSGAEVTATYPGQRFGAGTPRGAGPVRTDAAGEFRLELLGGSTFELEATRFGAKSATTRVAVVGGEETAVVVRFESRSLLTGVVLAPDGAPSAGAVVRVWESGAASANAEAIRLETTSDDAGAFLFELFHPGAFALLASSTRHACSAPVALELARGEDRAGLVLELTQPAAIEGRVLDADGAPLADVLVAAHRDERAPDLDPAPPGVDTEAYHGFAQTTTDAQGRFELTPLRPGATRYVVLCLPDAERPDRVVRERGVRAGATDVLLALTEERMRGGFVHLRVRAEAADEPPERVVLELAQQRPDGTWSSPGLRDFETPHGEWLREGLEPGVPHALCLYQGFGAPLLFTETFVASLEGARFDVELLSPRPIELRIDTAGAAAPRVIHVQSTLPHPLRSSEVPIPLDRNGRAHVPLAPGTYLARIADELHEFRVRPIEELQIVRIDG